MTTILDKIKEYLNKKGYSYSANEENESVAFEHKVDDEDNDIVIPITITTDGYSMITVQTDAVWQFNEDGYADACMFVNDLNCTWNFVRFCVDEDGGFYTLTEAIVEPANINFVLENTLGRVIVLTEDAIRELISENY